MATDITGVDEEYNREHYFLGFRETVMLALGYFPNSITRSEFYQLYSRTHAQLSRIEAVNFPLPEKKIFYAMLRKLHGKNIIQETYMKENYAVSLSDAGEAGFDVILSNLQRHPLYERISNVFDFYRTAPIL